MKSRSRLFIAVFVLAAIALARLMLYQTNEPDFEDLPLRYADDITQAPVFAEAYQKSAQQAEPHIMKESTYWPFAAPPAGTRLASVCIIHPDTPAYSRYYDQLFKTPENPVNLNVYASYFEMEHLIERTTSSPSDDVLNALGSFDPEMREIESAVARPNAYWPTVSRTADLWIQLNPGPYLDVGFADVWRLRAVAYLDKDRSDLAAADFQHCLDSIHSLLRNPRHDRHISYNMLAVWQTRDLFDILWEGEHRHLWSIPQLQQMESDIGDLDSEFTKIGDYYPPDVQSYARLALLSCHLELFKLSTGAYPEKLSDLPDLPSHLDEEISGGKNSTI